MSSQLVRSPRPSQEAFVPRRWPQLREGPCVSQSRIERRGGLSTASFRSKAVSVQEGRSIQLAQEKLGRTRIPCRKQENRGAEEFFESDFALLFSTSTIGVFFLAFKKLATNSREGIRRDSSSRCAYSWLVSVINSWISGSGAQTRTRLVLETTPLES